MGPSPYRVGIDIVDISAIQDSMTRFGQRFLDRIFTSGEQEYCLQLASQAAVLQSLAARFAAKEATLKVLRPVDDGVAWVSIEIHRAPQGWCDILLHHQAKEMAQKRGISALSLSMSHEKNIATAIVIADFVQG